MIDLVAIPKENTDEVWVHCESMIADALSRSGYALAEHMKEWIKKGKMQLWFLWDTDADVSERMYGVVVTEIIQRPLHKSLNIKVMTGKHRDKWQHLVKKIEKFAWENDCDLMELVARPGWEKVLRRFGYSKSHVVLEKYNKEKK